MAYRNMDGRITIDEYAAKADINKEAAAAEILRDAVMRLQEVSNMAGSFQGQSVRAIEEKAEEMRRRAETLISRLQETQDYTRKVIAYYEMIDRKCQDALSGGSGHGYGDGGGGFRGR